MSLDRLRYSRLGLALTYGVKRFRYGRAARGGEVRHGFCPVCERQTRFFCRDRNPRDGQVCVRCGSVPRQRAISRLAGTEFRDHLARVHEASPSLCSYQFFRRHSPYYCGSYYFPDSTRRQIGSFSNLDLCRDAGGENRFDLVVTQDVLEHVPMPSAALQNIHRSLRPGGVHLFTVPRDLTKPTAARAEFGPDGVRHLAEPEYHRDPISQQGSLVVTDWGVDAAEVVADIVAAPCTVKQVQDDGLGVFEAIEVFVAAKPE